MRNKVLKSTTAHLKNENRAHGEFIPRLQTYPEVTISRD